MDRVGWSVPAWLVVSSVLGCAGREAPGDETQGDTETPDESTSASPSTTESTGDIVPPGDSSTTSATTVDPTTGIDTIDPTTTTTGDDTTTGPVELPDCGAIAYVAECEDEDLCAWQPEVGCIVDCEQITDASQCMSLAHCEWLDDCGDPGPI